MVLKKIFFKLYLSYIPKVFFAKIVSIVRIKITCRDSACPMEAACHMPNILLTLLLALCLLPQLVGQMLEEIEMACEDVYLEETLKN